MVYSVVPALYVVVLRDGTLIWPAVSFRCSSPIPLSLPSLPPPPPLPSHFPPLPSSPLPSPSPPPPAMFQPGLQINTDSHPSKQVVDGNSSVSGLPRKVSPAQEGGQADTGTKSPKTQGSESLSSMSTSQGGGAEKVATPTSPQSASVFNWSGAKEDMRGVVQVWFGFEDGNLVAVTAGSCLQLYRLSTSPRKEVVKVRGRPWYD